MTESCGGPLLAGLSERARGECRSFRGGMSAMQRGFSGIVEPGLVDISSKHPGLPRFPGGSALKVCLRRPCILLREEHFVCKPVLSRSQNAWMQAFWPVIASGQATGEHDRFSLMEEVAGIVCPLAGLAMPSLWRSGSGEIRLVGSGGFASLGCVSWPWTLRTGLLVCKASLWPHTIS
jgi:hypothetical protein